MTKQHEITNNGPLLNKDGTLREPGYSKTEMLTYSPKDAAAFPMRLKEWDYYFISDGYRGIAFTVADNSYMALGSVTLFEFRNPKYTTKDSIKMFPSSKTVSLPSVSRSGLSYFRTEGFVTRITVGGSRTIECLIENFTEGKNLTAHIELTNEPFESMYIATPFKRNKKAFYYNRKVNCLKASGFVDYGNSRIEFSPENTSAVLDWGRGVWTYSNTWYWGSASGYVDKVPFGFNIGYGFGDTSAATENMIFYNGKAHKFDEVKFNIPQDDKGQDDFMQPWTFTSNDGKFEMDFIPLLDRNSYTSLGIILSDQHQVFGHFTGRAILEDGTIITIKDFFGFAEKVRNKW